MCRELIDFFNERSILILGFGREGRSTYDFIRKHLPQKHLAIADLKNVALADENVTVYCGDQYLDAVNDYDLVMKSPGISVKDIDFKPSVMVACQTDLFLQFANCKTVGITGTKGKTTTSTLVHEILKAAGMNTCLIGNIGIPVFEELEQTKGLTAVIEMSSHQLEFTHHSPDVAILTNIYPEHLDHYKSYRHYAEAKLNIVTYQTSENFFIFNADQDLSEFIDLSTIHSQKIAVSVCDGDKDAFLGNLATINPHLKGKHNQQDIFYAVAAAKCLGIDNEAIQKGIAAFRGIEHRMELVGTYKGITFYNDCIATIPTAVACAVEALGEVDSLIFGGMDRGLDYGEFTEYLKNSKIKNLICLPKTGHTIGKTLIKQASKKNIVLAKDMEQAVNVAFEFTAKGKICLLSPAASSYNFYKNFEEKGRHYKSLITQAK